ncbi:MDR family MFS transporter [Bifidobacterium aquikefiricola]|uniref:MDR family MFS transporter n=1 Tax=Bifidobacterium aquikefiricola TaxID=3059038 RepID=A0AB39U8D3_9BIFI
MTSRPDTSFTPSSAHSSHHSLPHSSPISEHVEEPQQSPSIGRLVAALMAGAITPILDSTIVAVGMNTLVAAFHAPIATMQWVTTGYLLALALAVPFVSWAQNRFGGKRTWIFALSLFVLGSVLCACAWNVGALIAFRVLQGIGGGILLPLMQTLAMQNVPAQQRTKTIANISLPIALGPILGPVLGGIVLNWLTWHWLFLINVPIGIVGLVLAALYLKSDAPTSHTYNSGASLDVRGAVLLCPGLAGLMYGLSKSYDVGGFGRSDVLVSTIGGAVFFCAFILWAMHTGDRALINVRLLRLHSVSVASFGMLFAGAISFAGNFALPLYFQLLRGDSVLNAAFFLIPQGLGALLARFFISPVVERLGARLSCFLSMVLMFVATLPFAYSDAHTNLWFLGTMLFLRGLGQGFMLIPMMSVAYNDVPIALMPHASAITRIVQQLGGAFATALVAVVLTLHVNAVMPVRGFDQAFWVIEGFTIVSAIIALFLPSVKTEQKTLKTA